MMFYVIAAGAALLFMGKKSQTAKTVVTAKKQTTKNPASAQAKQQSQTNPSYVKQAAVAAGGLALTYAASHQQDILNAVNSIPSLFTSDNNETDDETATAVNETETEPEFGDGSIVTADAFNDATTIDTSTMDMGDPNSSIDCEDYNA